MYGGVGSGLYRSDDGGTTWTRLQNVTGPPCSYDTSGTGLTSDPSLGRIGVAVAPSDPNRVYVVAGTPYGPDKGFYVSNDGGDSFTCGGRRFATKARKASRSRSGFCLPTSRNVIFALALAGNTVFVPSPV